MVASAAGFVGVKLLLLLLLVLLDRSRQQHQIENRSSLHSMVDEGLAALFHLQVHLSSEDAAFVTADVVVAVVAAAVMQRRRNRLD